MSANALNFSKNIIGVVFLVPTALLVEGASLPSFTNQEWLILLISGYLGIAVADSWYFRALRSLGAGRTAIVASLYSPFVVILSYFLLAEKLALWQWLGFALVLLGILIVVYQKKYRQLDQRQLYSGIAFAAASVFLTALGVVMVKPILEQDGFFWIVCIRLSAGILGMLIFFIVKSQLLTIYKEIRYQSHNWLNIFFASFIGTYLAMMFWLSGFKYTDASIASVLNETANIFIVLFAWFFLKEEFDKRKLLGVILAFCGVVVFVSE